MNFSFLERQHFETCDVVPQKQQQQQQKQQQQQRHQHLMKNIWHQKTFQDNRSHLVKKLQGIRNKLKWKQHEL